MVDAPVLSSGQAGTLIGVLDACLINGFSVRTPDSIQVVDGVATVSISAGNPYEKHAVVAITGASNAALNANWRIAASTATSFDFACPGVASGTVTGASIKRAGAGWAKPFADTHVGVYRSTQLDATQLFLQVNDVDPRYARVRGYEQMTGAKTGETPFPALTELAETAFTWIKSSVLSSAPVPWVLVSDGSIFHALCYAWGYEGGTASPYRGAVGYTFGDLISFIPGDAYHCMASAFPTATPSHPGVPPQPLLMPVASSGRYLARGADQLKKGIYAEGKSILPSYTGTGGPLPGGRVNFHPMFISDGDATSDLIRGQLPGIFCAHERAGVFIDRVVSEDEGRAFLIVHVAGSSFINRVSAFEIVGPWR